jgi:hypothetical protein
MFRVTGHNQVHPVLNGEAWESIPGLFGGVKCKNPLGSLPPFVNQHRPELPPGKAFPFKNRDAPAADPGFFINFQDDPVPGSQGPLESLPIMIEIQFLQILYPIIVLGKYKKRIPFYITRIILEIYQPHDPIGDPRLRPGTAEMEERTKQKEYRTPPQSSKQTETL